MTAPAARIPHRFPQSKARGDAGEADIIAWYGGEPAPPGSAHDLTLPFRCTPLALPTPTMRGGDVRVELKTDSYDPRDYPCAFLERHTQRPDGTKIPGGPWRAARDGLDVFMYYYPTRGLVLWMWDLDALCGRLELALARVPRPAWRRVGVLNVGGYRALGRLVPRTELAALAAPHYHEEYIRVEEVGT